MLRMFSSVIALLLFLALLSPGANTPVAADSPHSYFDALVSRPEHWKSFSLRDRQQLATEREGGYAFCNTCPLDVTYDPSNDPDPRRQDAAKIVIPRNSLRNQVRLPLRTSDGNSYFVTWDDWFGAEYDWRNTNINSHKSFQFSSGDTLWFEIQTRFNLRRNGLAEHSGRAYNAYGRSHDIAFGPNVTSLDPLPQVGTFSLQPETWTRYWVVIDQRPGNDYDLVSLWIADEAHNPVQVLDKIQLNAYNGRIDKFWIEFNASADYVPPGRGPLVAYVRNVAMLMNVVNPTSLMQRPNAGTPLPPPPPKPGAPRNLRIITPPVQ